jgi:hypothetical protein
MGAYQQTIITNQEPVRREIEATAFMRAGVVICQQALPETENHQIERAVVTGNTEFPAFRGDIAGLADSL